MRPGLEALLAMCVPLRVLRTEAADCLVRMELWPIVLVQLIGDVGVVGSRSMQF